MLPSDAREHRATFFRLLYGEREGGYMCVGYSLPDKRGMAEEFFRWPNELDKALDSINAHLLTHNVYFCPTLLQSRRRTSDNVLESVRTAHADLDSCHPDNMLVKPTFVIETSPGRYQALWTFEDYLPPDDVEDVSHRLAYFHAFQGADRGCWDIVHFLRAPFTYNRKPAYGEGATSPNIKLADANRSKYRISDFVKYPPVPGGEKLQIPLPSEAELPNMTPEDLAFKYKKILAPYAVVLHGTVPEKDWSGPLWNLLMLCFEAGMTREEVFLYVSSAKCNKYARDNRTPDYLWKDVCRAYVRHEMNITLLVPSIEGTVIDLLTDKERELVTNEETFVDRYISWAKTVGDAAWQYHQAGAFVALSAILSGAVRLPTSFGIIKPNLWFMILADTTLTRKSTAMDIVMDLIGEVNDQAILATDGSIEGLMTSLALRPGQPSIFLRDEVSGLFEQFTKRDYYAGMAETLTKLYDGRLQKRVLRKEIIEVRDPVLVFFAGGIKNKVLSILTTENVSSGFLPRFVFITAESDISNVRPLGPPTDANLGARQSILEELGEMHIHYHSSTQYIIDGAGGLQPPVQRYWDAQLTPAAWELYNRLEKDMMKMALGGEHADIMTPTYDRLSKSGLKAAILLAASRQRTDGFVEVSAQDMLKAIQYVEGWRPHTDTVISNLGKSVVERELERITHYIIRKPGTSRSQLMQTYHLQARQTDAILTTLEQRGLITRHSMGRGEQIFPTSFIQSASSQNGAAPVPDTRKEPVK